MNTRAQSARRRSLKTVLLRLCASFFVKILSKNCKLLLFSQKTGKNHLKPKVISVIMARSMLLWSTIPGIRKMRGNDFT